MPTSASLDRTLQRLADADLGTGEDIRLEDTQARALDHFLAGVERRAFRIAQVALRDPDDALDVVQGAMLRLSQSYAQKPPEELQPLFYRILYNGIRDAQRRRSVRSRFFGYLPGAAHHETDEDAPDPIEQVADPGPGPSDRLVSGEAMQHLEAALAKLPLRQREAFMLRCLEGLDVAATADVMGCTAGSVKTHYFRALQALRGALTEVWV